MFTINSKSALLDYLLFKKNYPSINKEDNNCLQSIQNLLCLIIFYLKTIIDQLIRKIYFKSIHDLLRHLDDVLDVVDLLHPVDRNSGDSELGPEAGPDEDGPAAAVATGQHVRPQGGLVRGRVQQADQGALKDL